MKKMNNKLIRNFIVDLKKEEIDYFERAEIINQYLKDNNMSQRQLAQQLNIPHSTIQDWCRWSNLTKEQYDKLKTKYSDSEIYRILRNSRSNVEKRINICKNELDDLLKLFLSKLRAYILSSNVSIDTENLIQEVNNVMNRILINNKKK